MYLTKEDIKTHMRSENLQVITRGDDTLITSAIDSAVSEAKGYLASFDKDAIFSTEGNNRNALLLTFIKDISAWHLINICNAGNDFELRQTRYERAVDWLKAVQAGKVQPDLPALSTTDGEPTSAGITFGSNAKRNQHF